MSDNEVGSRTAHTVAIMTAILVAAFNCSVEAAAARAMEIMWYVNDHHVAEEDRRRRGSVP